MVNVNDYERQNLLIRLLDKHKEIICICEERREKYSREAMKQFQLMDIMVQEMIKANARELDLYRNPET